MRKYNVYDGDGKAQGIILAHTGEQAIKHAKTNGVYKPVVQLSFSSRKELDHYIAEVEQRQQAKFNRRQHFIIGAH